MICVNTMARITTKSILIYQTDSIGGLWWGRGVKMAKRTSRVQKNTAVLNSIRKALPENTRALVVGMATGVEEYYRDNAPRDTGSMAESVYVQLKDSAYQHGKPTSAGAVESQARGLL